MNTFKKTLYATLAEAAQAAAERKCVIVYLDPDVYETSKSIAAGRRPAMNVAATLAVEARWVPGPTILTILGAGFWTVTDPPAKPGAFNL